MKFSAQYIRHGDFQLHSGQTSNIFYDVNQMLTNDFYLKEILGNIPFCSHYIGIATGGAMIARLVSWERNSKFSMIKDGELKGNFPRDGWLLIDDVVTTGKSLEGAIQIVGKIPKDIWVVLDRRDKNQHPEVCSVYER